MTEGDARTTRGILGDADARSTAGIIFIIRRISIVFGDKLSIVSRTIARKVVVIGKRSVCSLTKNRKISQC